MSEDRVGGGFFLLTTFYSLNYFQLPLIYPVENYHPITNNLYSPNLPMSKIQFILHLTLQGEPHVQFFLAKTAFSDHL